MDGFQRELLARLPLADSVLSVLSFVFDQPFLEKLFAEHRGRCYEAEEGLSFPQVVELVRDALLVHQGSGRAAFQAAEESGDLPVLVGSVYQKLSRLPVELSMALLSQGCSRLPQLLPQGTPCSLPPSLWNLELVAFDGKVLKHVPHLLKPLRKLQGKLLGGRVLAALALGRGLVLAMNATPDGERNDVPLVPATVQQVRQQITRAILWIGDRQFSDLKLFILFSERGDHFLIRQNRTLHFVPDPQRPAQEGLDSRGRRFVQQWGWAGVEAQKNRRYVRRITLFRPEAEDPKDREVHLLTDLLDETRYPAQDLLEAYLQRWGIERVFQRVTEVFNLRHLIGTQPQAIIFQAAFCFVIYNMIQVVRWHIAQARGKSVEEVSTQTLFEDIEAELVSWCKLGESRFLQRHVRQFKDAPVLRDHLQRRLGKLWRPRWAKCPTTRRPGGKRRTVRARGNRSSVWKVLQADRQHKPRPKPARRRC